MAFHSSRAPPASSMMRTHRSRGSGVPDAQEAIMTTTARRRWGFTLALAPALLLGLATVAPAGAPPLTRDLELEALTEAVRWPNAEVPVILGLTGRFLGNRQDRDGYAYFQERARSQPDRPLFLALEGFFQARIAGEISLFRRVAWVNDAVAKLDQAVERDPSLPRYFRGLVLAELPTRFGKADAALADLAAVLESKERFPVGLRRPIYRAQARAYSTLGREADARAALARSGYPSLDPEQPVFVTDYWVTAKEGFRFRPPRLIEPAPGVHVAQGYDFGDVGFVLTR